PSIKQFVLRMPTTLHERVIQYVVEEIVLQRNSIRERNDSSGEFARNIKNCGSPRLTFPILTTVYTIQMAHFNTQQHNILGSSSKFLTLKRRRTYHVWQMTISLDQTAIFAL